MGCFCREAVQALKETAEPEPDQEPVEEQTPDPLVPAVSEWLAARWLPSPKWEPDLDWLEDEELADPPMEPAALATLLGLFQAQQACQDDLGTDPTDPDQVRKLARIVGTLNRRMKDLAWVEQEDRPWERLALLNSQADTVREAAEQGVFEPKEQDEPPLAPWRPLLAKLKAISPLVVIAQWQKVDLADPETADALAETVRKLRKVALPPLENPLLLMRVIARTSAVARLLKSLGADPRTVPFERVQKAVERKVEAAKQLLPKTAQVRDGRLDGMPTVQPNPTQLLNRETIEHAQKIAPETLEKMRWQVPPQDELDLLISGAPVAAFAKLMKQLGPDPVRSSPCGPQCDAGAVGRALAA